MFFHLPTSTVSTNCCYTFATGFTASNDFQSYCLFFKVIVYFSLNIFLLILYNLYKLGLVGDVEMTKPGTGPKLLALNSELSR